MRRLFVVILALGLLTGARADAQAPTSTGSGAAVIQCVVEQQNINRRLEGSLQSVRCARDGAVIEVPWKTALALEGRVFVVNCGGGATLVTGKAFAQAQPDCNLDIPQGVAILPFEITFHPITDAGTVTNVFCQAASSLIGAGTSSAATVGPTNVRTDAPFASRVTARQAYSANGTAPTVFYDLVGWGSAGTASATFSGPLTWIPDSPPVLIGPASLNCYAAATTTQATFKMLIRYAELPASAFQ